MGAAAGPLAVASAGASLLSGVMQGEGQKAADDYQAQKLQRSAEIGRLAATQTDAQMTENLNTQLGNIDAVRTAQNADPTSPTSVAVRNRATMIGDRAKSIQVGNIMQQATQNEADAAYMHQAGDFALQMGIVGGVAGAANTVAKTKWS